MITHRSVLTGVLLAIVAHRAGAQRVATRPDSVCCDTITVRDYIYAQLERSWISPGTLGKRLYVGTVDSLLFEGNIAPQFTVVDPRVPLGALSWIRAVAFSPKVVLRMLTTNSNPVRIPNFMPGALFFIRSPFHDSTSFVLFRINHFSNGGEDSAVEGGRINLKSGNFSTNYLQLGYSQHVSLNGGSYLFLPIIPIEWHFDQDSLEKADYGHWRSRFGFLYLESVTDPLSRQFGLDQVLAQLEITEAWDARRRPGLFGRQDGMFTLAWLPQKAGDLGVFAAVQWGRDYYNIQFTQRKFTMLRFGIMAGNGKYRFTPLPGDACYPKGETTK